MVCLSLLIEGGVAIGDETAMPEKPLVIDIMGSEYRWHYRYPGPDETLGTADDIRRLGDLHLSMGTPVVLQLKSEDYIYTFKLPHIDRVKMAVPEIVFTLEFTPDSLGTFELEGDQMCGFSHESLKAKLIVETQEDFATWLVGKDQTDANSR